MSCDSSLECDLIVNRFQFSISHREFLEPGAPCEINIDSKTMEKVQLGLKSPTRFTFDAASEHIYALLLKKDCYPRFIRSEHYKSLLATGIQPSHKKRFFGFGGAAKKKSSTTAPPNITLLSQVTTPRTRNQCSDSVSCFHHMNVLFTDAID